MTESNRQEWDLAVVEASHNHGASENLAELSEVRALIQEQEQQIITLSRGGALPRVTLSTMRAADPSFRATRQDIYNVKKRDHSQFLLGRTPLEALLETLEENQAQYKLDRDSQHQLSRLLIVPKTSVSTSQEFSSGGVLLMDSTYKTNKFQMPLLHVMGVSCTNQSFSLCYVFLRQEKEECYLWALQQMKSVFEERIAGPIVVVTGRELALMAAIALVLPEAKNLLCIWHIDKNVLPNSRKHFTTEEDWKSFYAKWGPVNRSETEEAFDEKWVDLKNHIKDIVYAYLESVWIPHREKFVLAWTKKARHFGHVATSRVEGGHATLKKWIAVSTGDLASVYDKLVLAGQQQRQTISQKVGYDCSHTIIRLSGAFGEMSTEESHILH